MSRYTGATRVTVMWLLLLLAVPGNCRESTDGPYYLTKNITHCPDVGYFFELESMHQGSNDLDPGACYLCFCQEVGKANCVRRNRKKCEVVRHHHVRKRESRSRRNVFFKDVFRPEENEKPLYPNLKTNCSLGDPKKTYACPPGLCEGCLMCECTAEGHWNCNVTSECLTDDKEIKNNHGIKMSTTIKTNVTETMTNTNSKKLQKVIRKSRHTTSLLNKPHYEKYNDTAKEITLNKTNTLKIVKNPKDEILEERLKEKVRKNIAILKKKRNIKQSKALKLKLHDFFRNRNLSSNNDTKNEKIFKDKDFNSKLKLQGKTNMTNTEAGIKKVRNKRSILLLLKSNTTNDQTTGIGTFVISAQNSTTEPTFDTIVSTRNNSKVAVGKSTVNYSYIDINLKTNKASHFNVNSDIYVAKAKHNIFNREILRGVVSTEKYQNLLTALINDIRDDKVSNVTNERKSLDFNISNQLKTHTLLTEMKTNFIFPEKIQDKYTKNKLSFPTEKSNGYTSITGKFKNHTIPRIQEFPQYNKSETNTRIEVNISKDENKKNLTKSDIEGDLDSNLSQQTNGTGLLLNLINNVNKTLRKIPTQIDIIEFDAIASNINQSLDNTLYTIQSSINSYNKNEKKTAKKLKKKSKSGKIHKTKLKKYVIIKSSDDQHRQTKSHLVIRNNGTSKKKLKDKNNVTAKYAENSMVFVIRNKKNQKNTTSSSNTFRNYNLLKTMSRALDQNALISNKKFVSDLQTLRQESKIISKKLRIITKLLNFITFLDDKKSTGDYQPSQDKTNEDTYKLRAILDGSYSTYHRLQTLPKTQFSKHIKNELRVKNHNLMRELVVKFKTLLFKYNLIQNIFFKKIYDVIENFELNLGFQNDIKTAKIMDKSRHVNRNVTELDTNTKEILDNLQHLKEIFIKRNKKHRGKRQIYRDDNHLEYLLILMEYLIKQSLHLNSPSANDGIDLLIEAIRNAPDIKPIKKKVLQYIPVPVRKKAARNRKVYEDSESINSNPSEDDFISEHQGNITKEALKEDDFLVKIYNTTKDYLNKYKYFGGVKPHKRTNLTIILNTKTHENNSQVAETVTQSPPSTTSLVNEVSVSRKFFDEKSKNITLSTPDIQENERTNDGPYIKINFPNSETTLILETETDILENSSANNKSKEQSATERKYVERPIAENESNEDEPDETSENEPNGTLIAVEKSENKLNTDKEISEKITTIKESISNKELNRGKNTIITEEMTTKGTSTKSEIVTNDFDDNKENKLSNNDDKIVWVFSSEDEENIIDKEETTTPIGISITNSRRSYGNNNITKDVDEEPDYGEDDVDEVMYQKELGFFNSLDDATEKYDKIGDKEIANKNTEEYLN